MVASLRAGAAAVVVAAAMTLVVPAVAVPVDSAGPGTVISTRPLPRASWIPGAGDGSALTYRTTGPGNDAATSTGALFLPPGDAPPGGWPVLSWAHGAVGIADACAPTVTGKIGGPYLGRWLAQGYAVVAISPTSNEMWLAVSPSCSP